MRQPVPKTVELARDLHELAADEENPAKLAIAHRALGYSLRSQANFEKPAKSSTEE
jgi:hypothetical protein